ncbi:MAG: hypothetical protein H0U87_06525 [Acidobacteria bacterium]|nr:hypothetical protein [Acidobacteriota bacterium]
MSVVVPFSDEAAERKDARFPDLFCGDTFMILNRFESLKQYNAPAPQIFRPRSVSTTNLSNIFVFR